MTESAFTVFSFSSVGLLSLGTEEEKALFIKDGFVPVYMEDSLENNAKHFTLFLSLEMPAVEKRL